MRSRGARHWFRRGLEHASHDDAEPGSLRGAIRRRVALALVVSLIGGAASGASDDRFVRRVRTDDGRVQLEVAARSYRKEGDSCLVSLVGVVHIGEAPYYERIQRLLDDHALVLYESVAPRGVERHLARRDADPVQVTRDSMLYLRRMMLLVREADLASERRREFERGFAGSGASVSPGGASEATGQARTDDSPARSRRPAPSLDRTREMASSIDGRARAWVEQAMRDAWGRPIEFEALPDGGFLLVSLGADGSAGGSGEDADIRLRTPPERRAPSTAAEDGLQGALARALGLSFQLTAVDYDRRHWELADMSEREFLEAIGDPDDGSVPMVQALTGAGATANLARGALALLRVADGMSGGRLRESIKLLLIEVLAATSERTLARGLPPRLVEVILVRRNDVAMEELRDRLARRERPASVAVFYGAAHMPDLEQRLLGEGWRRVAEEWFPAISADPAAAGLGDADSQWIQQFIRDAMREAGLDRVPGGAEALR